VNEPVSESQRASIKAHLRSLHIVINLPQGLSNPSPSINLKPLSFERLFLKPLVEVGKRLVSIALL
jgi:hypothetical protein